MRTGLVGQVEMFYVELDILVEKQDRVELIGQVEMI